MPTQAFTYQDGDTTCQGFLALPENKTSAPIVLIAPDWRGRTEFANDKAKMLAEWGYIGFAIDVYGDGKTGDSVEENTALMMPFVEGRSTLLKQRLKAAYDAVKNIKQADQHNIAIMGYCFGGLCALDLARTGAELKGAISIHGLLTAPEYAGSETISAKVLVLHGYADPMVPPDQVVSFCDEMTNANVDWQTVMYGQVKHAFTNPEANDLERGIVYDEKAKDRSELTLRNFLNEIFN